MREIVARGDRNRNTALDSGEVRAIASSSGQVGVGTGVSLQSTREGELRITPRQLPNRGLAGLIDDLRLPPDRRRAALAALAQGEADITRTLSTSLETLRGEVRALVPREQFATVDRVIRNHGETVRGFLSEVAERAGQPMLPNPAPQLNRALRALGPTGDALTGIEGAVSWHLERIYLLAADRSGLLHRALTPVLTADELADFAASLERHLAILQRPS
jgi:hypothetical protein